MKRFAITSWPWVFGLAALSCNDGSDDAPSSATCSGAECITESGGAASRGPDGSPPGAGGNVPSDGGRGGIDGATGGQGGAAASSANGGAGGVGDGGSTDEASGGLPGSCREADCGSHKWACWKMPNPAKSGPTVPNHARYADLGNGAIRDDITCLTWEKSNPSAQGTWQDSHDRCAALAGRRFAGFDDWRLPTRIEMASITDVTLGRTGYPRVFDVTSGYYVTGSFWYKTILGSSEDRVWGYGTNGFTSNAIVRSNTNNVARCVRGNGDGEDANALAVEPPNHYSIGVDTVTDQYTGLTWQRGRSLALMAWADAPAYCAALDLDGLSGFRVPTTNELATTVNEAKVGGAIVDAAFPENPVGCREPEYWFWTAEASEVGGTAWGLSYCDGFTGWNAGEDGDWNYFPTANVRCVR